MTAPEAFFNSISPAMWSLIIFAFLLGLVIGWLIWGRALARNQQIAFEMAKARASADEAALSRTRLEKDLAAARDQVRPLADEVERLRREVARATSAVAPAAARPLAATASTDLSDLRQLKGVGDKLIARLNELGIMTVGDLAALDPGEAAEADARLGPFEGRIARDSWRTAGLPSSRRASGGWSGSEPRYRERSGGDRKRGALADLEDADAALARALGLVHRLVRTADEITGIDDAVSGDKDRTHRAGDLHFEALHRGIGGIADQIDRLPPVTCGTGQQHDKLVTAGPGEVISLAQDRLSAASPAAWPKRSFNALKLSIST
jgi:predicted flap endonuclease-1-like 5' DNA nuclease